MSATPVAFSPSDPTTWDIQEHVSYTLEARHFSSAAIHAPLILPNRTYCVTRYWHEQAWGRDQTSYQGKWRLCYQQSLLVWNLEFTEKLVKNYETTVKQMKEQAEKHRLDVGVPFWDRVKRGTYECYTCWELRHAWVSATEKEKGRPGTPYYQPFVLDVNTSQDQMRLFLNRISVKRFELSGYQPPINRAQRATFHRIEREGKKHLPHLWPESEGLFWEYYGVPGP